MRHRKKAGCLVDNVGDEHDLMSRSTRNIAGPHGALDFAKRDGIHQDPHSAEDA
jgi:hypothetical protein